MTRKLALVVALVTCVAPSVMAQSRTHHTHITRSRLTHSCTNSYQWPRSPGYAITVPAYPPYRGWNCVTDEGQGRLLPCEMGGG
jgi:hypothetical protein